MKIISRGEALAQGLKRYFTGKPCHAGHVAERRSKDGHCVECSRDRYPANPEEAREAARRWRETNPEKAKVTSNRWRETYPEKFRAYRREYMREYMRQRRAAEKAVQQVTE